MRSLCVELMKRPEWIEEIHEALRPTDPQIFAQGDAAAQELGIDTREIHFARVRAEPFTSSSWHRLLQQTKEERLEEVLSFAEEALPLDQIATGPADLLGLGDKFAPPRALDWILQDLKSSRTRLEISASRAAESGHQEQESGPYCVSRMAQSILAGKRPGTA
jgi:hypothetical protein